MKAELSISLPLPPAFRSADFLTFHRRDPQGVAERVGDSFLEKGMLWRDVPACLSIRFEPGSAKASLAVDGPKPGNSLPAFESMVRRMLGLTQDIEEFEARYRSHPQIGGLIARQHGLRVPVAATPFEALTWAVTGQQISVSAAVSLRRKLILAADVVHSCGLFCHPGARQIAALAEETLRQAGFSTTKTKTLLTLSQMAAEDRLPLDAWAEALPAADVVREKLEAVRGIGPWTASYALLRGFGWLDGSLHGDVAVRRGLEALLGFPAGEKEVMNWLAQFSPWRALVAAHIWASRSASAY